MAEDECQPCGADVLASFPNLRALAAESSLGGPDADWGRMELQRLPEEVRTGILGNGLTYFVQENKEPKSRAELFLVVGFGSLVEEEEERGIAHIVEHLGFSATKAYENHAIVKFLESIGAPFGACQNAYTSFDRTVYTLHVPTDKEGLVKESLTVLREFAYFTRISEEDLDKERKVVLEEWRESRNAQGRLFEQYITALCKGCKWCERLPIGKEEVIRGVPAETIRQFYRRFYHPGKMAVVCVGDFDIDVVEGQVKELFDLAPEAISPLPRDPTSPERPQHAVPDSEGVTVASSTDPELSFAQGMIDCKRPRQAMSSVQALRRRLTEDLFHRALSSRLLKLTLEPKGPRNFFSVSTETGEPIPPLNPMSISIAPLPGRMRPAVQAIVREIERAKRQGFHETEVIRAKRAILAEFEEEYIERDQRASSQFAEEYVSLFLDSVPAASVKRSAELAACILPGISCAEVSRVGEEFSFERNVVVKIATPPLSWRNPLYTCWSLLQACWNLTCPRPRLDLPTSAELQDLLRSVASEALEPWPADEDDVDSRLQLSFEACASERLAPSSQSAPSDSHAVFATGVPQPARGISMGDALAATEKEAPVLGEEVILRNGLRIFLKETNLFDDEIILRGRRWGGLSDHQGSGFLSNGTVSCEAQTCSMAAMMLGICGLSVESLQECLDGKRLEPNPPSMEAFTTALDASSSPTDLESLLMLLHLLFLRPVEPKATSRGRLTLVKLGLLAWRLGESRDPQAQFRRRVQKCITGDHPYSRLPSLWNILRLNFRKASAIFNERASRPCDWTFVLGGRLPPKETLLPLLEKYLGSIPNNVATPGKSVGTEDVGASCGKMLRRDESEAREAVTPLDVKFPSKSVRDEVKLQMIDPKGSTIICFPIRLAAVAVSGKVDTAAAELRDLFCLRLLVRLLETRLIEVLRFKRGQVYGVSVGDDLSMSPPHLGCPRRGTLTVAFECDPAEADELIEATQGELNQLRAGSAAFTEQNVTSALEQEKREFEELFHKNDWWINTVLDLYFSRCQAITGDIGETMALWWRVRAEVVGQFDAAKAGEVLQSVLPADAASAIITMRPKGRPAAKKDEEEEEEE